jgi:hypothetical protein
VIKLRDKMKPESELVLAVAKDVVFGEQGRALSIVKENKIDWEKFKDSVYYHGFAPFVFFALKGGLNSLPAELADVFKATFSHELRHSLFLQRSFLDLYGIFEERGLSMIPIKGVALLEDLYAQIPVRPSVDIDVLVKEPELEGAMRILRESGYEMDLEGLKESYWRHRQYHFVFTKRQPATRPLMLELHWALDYPRKQKQLLPDMFGRLRDFRMQDKTIKLLSPEDTFLSLALHQRRFGAALSLKDVCDMAGLLRKYESSFDWDYLLKQAVSSGLRCTVFFALSQVSIFFQIEAPAYVWKQLNIPAWKCRLIRRFIERGTFSMQKNLYLKCHFLLYDSLWEPIGYVLNIPREQFAKFYELRPYEKKTGFFYRARLLYIPLRALFEAILRPPTR